MIHTALKFLVDEVNEFIALKASGDTTRVELNALVDQDGQIKIGIDKIGCSLVNIEEERIGKTQTPYAPAVNGNSVKRNPPVKLNLYILFAANPNVDTTMTNYEEGLKLISFIITFFQSKNYFTQANSPGLDSQIEKLIVELYSLPVEQQNYLWGSLGAKYMPSVLYRIRLLEMQENALTETAPVIDQIGNLTGGDSLVSHINS
ncbi:MAG: DUF4255 domain-containing protein [Bacteroidetes bacterium]|nr:DUF4255 domain-containing protein [Bacteroidota bacterium]